MRHSGVQKLHNAARILLQKQNGVTMVAAT